MSSGPRIAITIAALLIVVGIVLWCIGFPSNDMKGFVLFSFVFVLSAAICSALFALLTALEANRYRLWASLVVFSVILSIPLVNFWFTLTWSLQENKVLNHSVSVVSASCMFIGIGQAIAFTLAILHISHGRTYTLLA